MAAASTEDAESFGQRSHPPEHLPIFRSSHSLNVQHHRDTQSKVAKQWTNYGNSTRGKADEVKQDTTRHRKSIVRHSHDADSDHEGVVFEEPFVMWTPYVPPEVASPTGAGKRSMKSRASDATIEKEISVRRLWQRAEVRARLRINEVRSQKAGERATGASANVHNFLLFTKSQQSIGKLEEILHRHDEFASSTRYRSLVQELANPAKCLQAFEDSVEYESGHYYSQLSDALVPLAQNAKRRQAETQQLREEMVECEQKESWLRDQHRTHHQVHSKFRHMMTNGEGRLHKAVEKGTAEFAECAQEIVTMRRDYVARLAYYHKYWEEMSELERRQQYIQSIIQGIEDRQRELEQKERSKLEGLEDSLKQLTRQADLLGRQCEEERLRSKSVFSWIESRVEERQLAYAEEMLASRFRRQQREHAYQRRAVVFRRSCLEREVRQMKSALSQAQKLYAKGLCVANVLDLRLRSLEASGLLIELQLRGREMTHEGCVLEPNVDNGLFPLILREMEVQLQWFAERCQPWEFCRSTLRLLRQPPLTTPLSLLRCSRELRERWEDQERLIEDMRAKSLLRMEVAGEGSFLMPTSPEGLKSSRNSRSNSILELPNSFREALAEAEVRPCMEDSGITEDVQLATYEAKLDLRLGVEELIRERQEEESKQQEQQNEKRPTNSVDVVFAAAARKGFKRKSQKAFHLPDETDAAPQVAGRPSCLDELANLPVTAKVVEWVGDQWSRIRGTLVPLENPSLTVLLPKMDDLLADLQEARDIAETSMYWVTEGSRGPGVFSDILLRELSWLMCLVDNLAERAGTIRGIVEIFAEVLNAESGPIDDLPGSPLEKVAEGSMFLLRNTKPLVKGSKIIQSAEAWHIRLMKALDAEAELHGACNSALRWYCGKFYGEGSADLKEISRGLSILRRLLTDAKLVTSGALNKMLSSELSAEMRIALKLALQREEPQAYESALLAMSVLESSTAEDTIGTSFPEKLKLPEEMAEAHGDLLGDDLIRKPSIPMIMLGIADPADPNREYYEEPFVPAHASGKVISSEVDSLLRSWNKEVEEDFLEDEVGVYESKGPPLMDTGSTMLPSDTSPSDLSSLLATQSVDMLRSFAEIEEEKEPDSSDEAKLDGVEAESIDPTPGYTEDDDSLSGLSLSESEGASRPTSSQLPSHHHSPAQSPQLDTTLVPDSWQHAVDADGDDEGVTSPSHQLESSVPMPVESDLESGSASASLASQVHRTSVASHVDHSIDELISRHPSLHSLSPESPKGLPLSPDKALPDSPLASPDQAPHDSPSFEDAGETVDVEDVDVGDVETARCPSAREMARVLINDLIPRAAQRVTPESIRAERTGSAVSSSGFSSAEDNKDPTPDQGDKRQSDMEQHADVRDSKMGKFSKIEIVTNEEELREASGGEDPETVARKKRSSVHGKVFQHALVGSRRGSTDHGRRPTVRKTHLVGMHGEGSEGTTVPTSPLAVTGHNAADADLGVHGHRQADPSPGRRSSPGHILKDHPVHIPGKQGRSSARMSASEMKAERIERRSTKKERLSQVTAPRHSKVRVNTPSAYESATSSADSAEGTDNESFNEARRSKASVSASPSSRKRMLQALSENKWGKLSPDQGRQSSAQEQLSPSPFPQARKSSATPNELISHKGAQSEEHDQRGTIRGSTHLSAGYVPRGVSFDAGSRAGSRPGSRRGTELEDSRGAAYEAHSGGRQSTRQSGRLSPMHHTAPGGTRQSMHRVLASGSRNSMRKEADGDSTPRTHGSSSAAPQHDRGGGVEDLSISGHHSAVEDADFQIPCSFADLERQHVASTDSATKASIKEDEHLSELLDHMMNEMTSPKKSVNRHGITDDVMVCNWLAKIEPEAASSALAEFMAPLKETDPDSSASTAIPDAIHETPEDGLQLPAVQTKMHSIVLSPRFPAVASRKTNDGAAARKLVQLEAKLSQPSNAKQTDLDLEMWLHQHQKGAVPWLKKIRENWQSSSTHDSAQAAKVAEAALARTDYGGSHFGQPGAGSSIPAAEREDSTVLTNGRLCGTPGLQVRTTNMCSGHGQEAPGTILKMKPKLNTDGFAKDLRPAAAEPWTPFPIASSPMKNLSGLTTATPRSPVKHVAKRRRREFYTTRHDTGTA